ncbi:MAG: hypothetical protein JKY37_04365 [Nannocystaceae bacterium]|nr:hypothetical protein [Nannocystaceae bacterium]
MTRPSILVGAALVGAATLLCSPGCSKQDSTGDPWMATTTAGSGDDDGGGGTCSLDASDPPLVFSGGADSAPGRVTALAIAGGTTVWCGAGFVATTDGSVDLVGTCTGLTVVDETTVAAVSDSGAVVLVSVGNAVSLLASAEVGTVAHDVAYDGVSLVVAVGAGGVASFDASSGSLTASAQLTTALDVRALAATADGWLVGGPGHITALGSDGAQKGSLEIRGSVTDVEFRDGLGLVARGPFGFDLVEVSGNSVTSVGNTPTEGSALDGALLDGAALLATGAAVHRYDLSGSDAALSARVVRPDEGRLVGEWVAAVAASGDSAVASVGTQVHALTLGGDSGGAVALLPRTTTSLFGEGDSEVVVLVRNGGNAELVLGELSVDGALAVASVEGGEARDGCEGQWTVPPGGSLLVTLEGSVPAGAAEVDLRLATNDANHEVLALPIEINRPSLAVGQPAPDFTMITFGGDVIDLDTTLGEIVFLKLFSYS